MFGELILFLSFRYEKAGIFEKMLHFDSSHQIVTCGSRVSRAPPHHILPSFINLDKPDKISLSSGNYFVEEISGSFF